PFFTALSSTRPTPRSLPDALPIWSGDGAVHPRLSRRSRALLHDPRAEHALQADRAMGRDQAGRVRLSDRALLDLLGERTRREDRDRKSTRLNSSHVAISYAVFSLK